VAVVDRYAQFRQQLADAIQLLGAPVVDHYRPRIALAAQRKDWPRVDELQRALHRDLDAATRPITDQLAKLPPPHAVVRHG
jgi:hypothetical protein